VVAIGIGAAAALLDLSPTSVRRLAVSGRLRCWRTPGGQFRLDHAQVKALRAQLLANGSGKQVKARR